MAIKLLLHNNCRILYQAQMRWNSPLIQNDLPPPLYFVGHNINYTWLLECKKNTRYLLILKLVHIIIAGMIIP